MSRSKPFARAVGGSRKFAGKVDQNATGSVNFFGCGYARQEGIGAGLSASNRDTSEVDASRLPTVIRFADQAKLLPKLLPAPDNLASS